MDITIRPRSLRGEITVIPSKSQAHRLLICGPADTAALSGYQPGYRSYRRLSHRSGRPDSADRLRLLCVSNEENPGNSRLKLLRKRLHPAVYAADCRRPGR